MYYIIEKTKNKVAVAVTENSPFAIVKDLGIYHLILLPPLTILFLIHVFPYINVCYSLILWTLQILSISFTVLSIMMLMMTLYNLTHMLL